jgi:hypothetical protein
MCKLYQLINPFYLSYHISNNLQGFAKREAAKVLLIMFNIESQSRVILKNGLIQSNLEHAVLFALSSFLPICLERLAV